MSDDLPDNDLDTRIRAAESPRRAEGTDKAPSSTRDISGGMEMIGSVVVCGLVGAGADRAAGTTPWIMIGMIMAGFMIGMYRLWLGMNRPDDKD